MTRRFQNLNSVFTVSHWLLVWRPSFAVCLKRLKWCSKRGTEKEREKKKEREREREREIMRWWQTGKIEQREVNLNNFFLILVLLLSVPFSLSDTISLSLSLSLSLFLCHSLSPYLSLYFSLSFSMPLFEHHFSRFKQSAKDGRQTKSQWETVNTE